jgi:hypothetical protein
VFAPVLFLQDATSIRCLLGATRLLLQGNRNRDGRGTTGPGLRRWVTGDVGEGREQRLATWQKGGQSFKVGLLLDGTA